jgi:hypothetical protein
VSRSLRLRSRRVRGDLPDRGQCSTGDPIAGLLSRGRERDLPGFQAVHPVPLPRSRTPAESTIPRLFVGLVDAAPASRTAKASACQLFRGSITRLQHLLPTLQEWCCHHPCKARFRLAGLPLPGGGRTLWIALKGFRSHFHSPFLDLSWRYRDELPPPHQSCLRAAVRAAYRDHTYLRTGRVWPRGEIPVIFLQRERRSWPLASGAERNNAQRSGEHRTRRRHGQIDATDPSRTRDQKI